MREVVTASQVLFASAVLNKSKQILYYFDALYSTTRVLFAARYIFRFLYHSDVTIHLEPTLLAGSELTLDFDRMPEIPSLVPYFFSESASICFSSSFSNVYCVLQKWHVSVIGLFSAISDDSSFFPIATSAFDTRSREQLQ